MKKIYLFLFFFSMILSSYSFAQKGIWIMGQLECGRFLASCDKSKLHIDCQVQTYFVKGYISGKSVGARINYMTKDTDTIKYAMIKYCRENPLNDTHEFAEYLFRKLTR